MRTCNYCGGEGVIEWFEDCWSYTNSCHFTIDHGAWCPVCKGAGVDEEVPEWLEWTPAGACDEPTAEDTATMVAHFAGGEE